MFQARVQILLILCALHAYYHLVPSCVMQEDLVPHHAMPGAVATDTRSSWITQDNIRFILCMHGT